MSVNKESTNKQWAKKLGQTNNHIGQNNKLKCTQFNKGSRVVYISYPWEDEYKYLFFLIKIYQQLIKVLNLQFLRKQNLRG